MENSKENCHLCFWRRYSGNLMFCGNLVQAKKMREDIKAHCPCKHFVVDKTLVRNKDGT